MNTTSPYFDTAPTVRTDNPEADRPYIIRQHALSQVGTIRKAMLIIFYVATVAAGMALWIVGKWSPGEVWIFSLGLGLVMTCTTELTCKLVLRHKFLQFCINKADLRKLHTIDVQMKFLRKNTGLKVRSVHRLKIVRSLADTWFIDIYERMAALYVIQAGSREDRIDEFGILWRKAQKVANQSPFFVKLRLPPPEFRDWIAAAQDPD